MEYEKRDGVRDGKIYRRNTAVEVYRLMLMWCIACHHMVIHNSDNIFYFNSVFDRLFLRAFFLPLGKAAVGSFVFVSIWFIAVNQDFSFNTAFKRVMSLDRTVLFYSIVLGTISIAVGSKAIDFSYCAQIFMPVLTGASWWFVTSYAFLILILPYLLRLLRTLTKKEHEITCGMLIVMLGVFRYLPFVSFPIAGSLVDFICLTIFTTFLRWHVNTASLNKVKLLGLVVASFAGGALCYYAVGHSAGLIHDFSERLWNGFIGSSASFLSLGISIPISLIVLNGEAWYSKGLNYLSKSSFAVYLISDFPFIRHELWKNYLTFSNIGLQAGIFSVLAVSLFVTASCLCFDLLRRLLLELLGRHLHRQHRRRKLSNIQVGN